MLGFLKCLSIIVVDHLVQMFDLLRNELKTEAGKQLFVEYQANPLMLHHLKPSNKVSLFEGHLDIQLQYYDIYFDFIFRF